MSGQNLRLLKFPHSTDEIISERINGLNKLICQSGDDGHILRLIEMIIGHLSLNYEGVYVDNTLTKLIEAHNWWKECYEPDATLSIMEDIDE
tara:strand:- start:1874 stop:2149 length:276 start_codon:yes stop_codon:yes gene_type:complete